MEMTQRDPQLSNLLASAAGYVVLPEIAKAGFVFGGSWGRGVLYEHGRPSGYVQLSQGSWGLQIGAESVSELIVLQTPDALAHIKAGKFEVGGNVTAVILTTGAAGEVRFANGVAVFAMPRGGAMAELTVAGQRLQYEGG